MTQTTGDEAQTRYLQWLGLLVILVVGLFLRVGTAVHTQVQQPVRADARQYVAYAWNLKFHDVYSYDDAGLSGHDAVVPKPDAFRTPGYPWLLRGLIHRHVGIKFIKETKFLQALIAEVTLLVSTLLAIELLGTWGGLAIGLLVALSPHQSLYVAYLLSETLYGLVIMLALGAGVLALKVRDARWRMVLAVLTGVLFGLACLVRPTLNQWALVLVVLLLWPPMRRFRKPVLLLAAGFVLAMAPWWGRNLVRFHELSDGLLMRAAVQHGSYPDFMYQGRPKTFGYPYHFDPGANKAMASWSGVFSDLRNKFENRPWAMLRWYVFGKVAYFFRWSPPDGAGGMLSYPVWHSPWFSDPRFLVVKRVIRALYVPLIVCGVLGMLAALLPWTRRLFDAATTDAARFLALLQLFVIGVHVVGAPYARYSVPFRPLTFLLAGFFVLWLARGYRAIRQTRMPASSTAQA